MQFEGKGTDFNVGRRLNPTLKKCRICLKEKFHILYKAEGASLKRRSEVFYTCRHRKMNLLVNVKTWAIPIFSIDYGKAF